MNRRKKTQQFFSYDGDFYYYMGKIFDVVCLGLLWIVGCLPIITIGASFTALHYAMYHSVKQDRGGFGKEFWSAYRKNFKESVPIWLIIAGVVLVLLLNMGILDQTMQNKVGAFFIILSVVIAAIFIVVGCYMFPALARFDMPVGWLFKLSFTMVFRHLPYSIFLFIIIAGSYLLIQNYILLIIFIPGPAAWVASLMLDPLLERYMPDAEDSEEEKKGTVSKADSKHRR